MINRILIFCSVLITCCTPKPQNSKTVEGSVDNATVSSASVIPQMPYDSTRNPFGVLTNTIGGGGPLSPQIRVKLATELGVPYMRTGTMITKWTGSSPANDVVVKAGFKMVMNINNSPLGGGLPPSPFPTDMVAYRKSISEIMDKYPAEVIVIENEEANDKYYTGNADQYLTMLSTAIEVAHSKGLRITNGGITSRELSVLVWKDYMKKGMTKEATAWGKACIPANFLSDLPDFSHNTAMRDRLVEIEKLLAAYKTMPLDYVNFHWYEPINLRFVKTFPADADLNHVVAGAMEAVVNYLHNATGKPIMTNEFGPVTSSPTLMTELMQEALNLKLPYAMLYSGDGDRIGATVPSHNNDGTLTPNGIAFRDFIKSHFKQ